jgi:conjugal transfer mating pair stabilization protein TraN
MTTPAHTSTVTDCSGQQFCSGGSCFNRGSPNDPDFARSMALMEAAREAGTYGSETEVFRGFNANCRIKLFGLSNCCKTSSGGAGMNNSAILGNLAMQGVSNAAGYIGNAASPYMYDFMFSSDNEWLTDRAVEAWRGGANINGTVAFNPSFSMFGLTWTTDVMPVNGLWNSANVVIGNPGGGVLYFNPYALAASIAIMIITDLMSCDQQEKITAMKRGQNLCYEVGTYCSSEIPIVHICIEHTKSYCCYNSRLARIINEQGRAQIGKAWGSPESPNCSGFSQAEFAAIDFSRMDLSEFTAEIMASVSVPSVSGISQNAQGVVQQRLQNYYQSGRQ